MTNSIRAGRCLTGVDSRSQGSSKFISVDEESYHEIVHVLRLGEAQRAAYEALDPSPQIDVFALNFLRVLLAYLMLLGIGMPLGLRSPRRPLGLDDGPGQSLVRPREGLHQERSLAILSH